MEKEEKYMERALELALMGRGKTSPNPMVGAVVVSGGKIVGEGYHQKVGDKHAEIHALKRAGEKARGADLYVNLEPCAHFGRTPPCAESIIEAGIKKVYISTLDPNPLVNGLGMAMLKDKGLDVETGLIRNKARKLNEVYFKHITTGMPFVIMKMAISMDGRIATRTGDSQWISNQKARKKVHEMRGAVDAVMVGVDTVIADDPLLNVRLKGESSRQPVRIILDSRLRMPLDCRMFRETPEINTFVAATKNAPDERVKAFEEAGVKVLIIESESERVDLERLLRKLGSRDIASVLIEGGSALFTTVVEKGLADKVVAFIAPLIIGGEEARAPIGGAGAETIMNALRLEDVRFEILEDNVMMEGYPRFQRQGGNCLPAL